MTTKDLTPMLHDIIERLARIETALAEARRAPAPAPAAAAAVPTVDDPVADLDSEYGDPEVRRDPPRWKDRKSTRLNSSHVSESRMPSSA